MQKKVAGSDSVINALKDENQKLKNEPVSYTHLEALFKVEADQLLVARQHPQLGDGRVSRDGDEVALHIDVGQRLAQRAGGVINPGPVSYTHLDVYKRQGIGIREDRALITQDLSRFYPHIFVE